MAEYVDLNEAIIDFGFEWDDIAPTRDEFINFLKSRKRANVKEIVYGRWVDNGIPDSILSGCSVCGFTCGASNFSYCPNCGAKMDESNESEN